MLCIAICDDLPEQLEKIKAAAEQYFDAGPHERPAIFTYNNSLLFLESLEKDGGYDIVLLDICMPGMDGMRVAAEIRSRKDKSEIIFLTTSDEFAVEAFALKAAHYLTKPFTQAQFDEAMDRAMERFTGEQSQKLVLRLIGGGARAIGLNEILWIESHGHQQTILLIDGDSVDVRESLSQILTELEKLYPGQFASPAKGYLVNQKFIRTVEAKEIIMCSGQTVPLSRGIYREFMDRYFAYQFPKDGQP